MYEVIVDVLTQDRSKHVFREEGICVDASDIQDFLFETGILVQSTIEGTKENQDDERTE